VSSGLAKLLDKSFVLGYALPALIFLSIVAGAFGCPDAVCSTSRPQNAFAQLTYAVLAVYILAVLLLAVNYWLYRFFEGYLPPVKWFAFSTEFHKSRLEVRKKEIETLTDGGSDASLLQWRLQREYPDEPGDVLPTAFGNAIRAFELYSYDVYRVDAIGAWPRLLAVIPKDFLTFVDDAKSLVDLWVNLAGLTLALGVFSLGIMVLNFIYHIAILMPKLGDAYCTVYICASVVDLLGRVATLHPRNDMSWGAMAFCSFVASYLAYLTATSLVSGWGEQVKSAFDCFLPGLAAKLGYAMPIDAAKRIKIWDEINNQVLYGVPFEHPPYAKTEKDSTQRPPPISRRNVQKPG
jgi:hypothetical protein